MSNLLLHILEFFHFCLYGIVVLITIYYPKFAIFIGLPIWYLTYILFDACILNFVEYNFGKNSGDSNMFYIFTETQFFTSSYISPLTPYGMIIISFIVGVYSLQLKNN